MNNYKLSPKELGNIIKDRVMRRSLAKQSHLWFDLIYFPQYFKYDFASFHYQLFDLIEHPEYEYCVALTFRGSGKSTIMTTSAPLYALFGKPQKKLILIVSQTADQVTTHMRHIKSELEANDLLKEDLGPFREVDNTWNSQAIYLPQQDAMIKAVSIDQGIRGLRNKQYRPDLIICDDIEDSKLVMTEEGRKRTQEIFSSEFVPLGDLGTQIMMVGNYLHPSGLLNKYRLLIESKKLKGKVLFVPLLNEDKQIAWPQKFPTMDSINKLRAGVADEYIWQKEYLLRFTADHDHFYTHENIHFYDDIPVGWEPYFQYRIAGLDLAISDKASADKTAMIIGDVYRVNGVYHIFILPNIVNKRLSFEQTIEMVTEQAKESDKQIHFFIENTGYQQALIEILKKDTSLSINGVSVGIMSKRERLSLTVPWNLKGQIHIPQLGAESLVNQLTGFGYEKHDDLADAATIMIIQVMELSKNNSMPKDDVSNLPQVVKFSRGDNSLDWAEREDKEMLYHLNHHPWRRLYSA